MLLLKVRIKIDHECHLSIFSKQLFFKIGFSSIHLHADCFSASLVMTDIGQDITWTDIVAQKSQNSTIGCKSDDDPIDSNHGSMVAPGNNGKFTENNDDDYWKEVKMQFDSHGLPTKNLAKYILINDSLLDFGPYIGDLLVTISHVASESIYLLLLQKHTSNPADVHTAECCDVQVNNIEYNNVTFILLFFQVRIQHFM